MTKILYITEGYIIQLIKFPAIVGEYTEIYEDSAWAMTQNKSVEEFLIELCGPSYIDNGFFREKNKVLNRLKSAFLRAEFEILIC
jgi:hypothetical protein